MRPRQRPPRDEFGETGDDQDAATPRHDECFQCARDSVHPPSVVRRLGSSQDRNHINHSQRPDIHPEKHTSLPARPPINLWGMDRVVNKIPRSFEAQLVLSSAARQAGALGLFLGKQAVVPLTFTTSAIMVRGSRRQPIYTR